MTYLINLQSTGRETGNSLTGNPGGLPNFAWTVFRLTADNTVFGQKGPIIVSGLVSRMQDYSNYGLYSCYQDTASKRPQYVTNVKNGKPVFRFNENPFLTCNLNLITTSFLPNVTGFIVFRSNVNSGDGKLFCSDGGFGRFFGFDTRASGFNFAYGNGVGGMTGIANLAANTWYLVSWHWNASEGVVSFWVNKNLAVSNIGQVPQGLATCNIGALNASSERFNGDIAEVIIYNRILTNEDRLATENYLSANWGLGI